MSGSRESRDRWRKQVRDARPLQLSDEVRPGEVVKVVGTVHADGPALRTPITAVEGCVLWEAVVDEVFVFSTRLVQKAMATRFSVTSTGLRTWVGSRPVMAVAARQEVGKLWSGLRAPAALDDFLRRHGQAGYAEMGRRLRWGEWRIQDGDSVEVMGRVHDVVRATVRPEAAATLDYRVAPEEELVGLTIELAELEDGWVLVSG